MNWKNNLASASKQLTDPTCTKQVDPLHTLFFSFFFFLATTTNSAPDFDRQGAKRLLIYIYVGMATLTPSVTRKLSPMELLSNGKF